METRKRPIDDLSHSSEDEDKERDASPLSVKNFSESFEIGQVVTENSLGDTICDKCQKPLLGNPKNILFNGKLLHSDCFVCATCQQTLERGYLVKDGIPYCEKDFALQNPESEVPSNVHFEFISQPAEYQIANYNIHPPPAISVDTPVDGNLTICMHLVESPSKTVVKGGFQSGDVRVLRASQSAIYFTGLKLNKMGPIKSELHFRNSKQLSSTFCVRFKIGERVIYSDPFKLVSSCSQLPPDIRELVRPTKKTPGSKPSKTDEEEEVTSPALSDGFIFVKGNNTKEEVLQTREELEDAIERADVDAAGKAAQKLALLKKLKMQSEARTDIQSSPDSTKT